MIYNSDMNLEYYFPPILGNGDISLAPDCEGTLNYTVSDYEEKGVKGFDGMVARCARRTANTKALIRSRLFSLGKFIFNEGSEIVKWSQELIATEGIVKSMCSYKDGTDIHTECFIHPTVNIYAVNKTFAGIGSRAVSYDFILEGFNEATMELENIIYTKFENNEAIVGFKLYGVNVYTGEIHITMDKAFNAVEIENGVRLEFEVSDSESVAMFYYLEDNYESKDFKKDIEELKSKIDALGFDGLKTECVANFKEFFELGYVNTPDKTLNEIYKVALYGLKCYTTKYSIAIGLNNAYWDGKFFAFDEYYSFYGLLTSNRAELAKRVPTFRKDVALDKAIKLATDCHKTEKTEEMVKFLWETDEEGWVEMSPIGPWLDHVFHMPTVGIGAYEYYEFTKDKEFLASCYRMIRACAKYFTKYMVYRDSDRLYIGKCTDLERLGAAAENPFMTSCGAIRLLEVCADASEILGIDEEYREECRYVASKLYESLPVENGMYVPLKNCTQKSIAVFAGKYPFYAIKDNDEKLIKAWEDFEENGAKFGNMYPGGTNISSWYACWKAESYARAKFADKAYGALKESYKSVGVFNELFEINEPGIRIKPWFSTAHGMFISSVNEMLIQSDEKRVYLLPAFPDMDGEISFKLAVKGGSVAEVKVNDNKLEKVVITQDGKDVTSKYEIFFKDKKIS